MVARSADMSHWPLFNRFPTLATVLNPVALTDTPTAVSALPAFGPQAWIKHDDVTHPVYGGNKLRKLEFVLAEMRQRGSRHVITLGATGTNSGVAASLICTQENLTCSVITFPQADSPTVQKNRAWMRHNGALFDERASLAQAVLRYYLHPQRLQHDAYFLFAGCSNPVSTFGYINAAFELQEQIHAGLLPTPDIIVVPVSSASTLAGLTLGIALTGLPTRVCGVRVAPSHLGPFAACTPSVVTRLMRQAMARLRHHAGNSPLPTLPEVWMTADYLGDGYGISSTAAETAMACFAEQGIALEATYSGKAAAAFLDLLRSNEGPVLFWNTFNSRPAPFRQA